ncbi:MAG: hypothetical protein KKD73_06500 [Proteobacteria bacterium]|nr:hypothetical protein [Pseudomonadota bacterium]MBU1639190.1 hypothetical protein [Pseudomonadota bacterium]
METKEVVMALTIFKNIPRALVPLVIVVLLFSNAWADSSLTGAGVMSYFKGYFGLVSLIWFVLLILLFVITETYKDTLIEGYLGTRLLFCFLILLNGGFIVSAFSFMPKEPKGWFFGIILVLILIIIAGSFMAMGNFLFMTHDEETGREYHTFSSTVHYDVISGSAAIEAGLEKWAGVLVVSIILCVFVFGSQMFLKHYITQENKDIANLLEEAPAILSKNSQKFKKSLLLLTKNKKVTELRAIRTTTPPITNGFPRFDKQENRIFLHTNNYGITLPISCLVSMENKNIKIGDYKNTEHYLFKFTYRVNGNDKEISMAYFDHSICGQDTIEDTTYETCIEIDDIVVLKNITSEMENYDPSQDSLFDPFFNPMRPPSPMYNVVIHFNDGEMIELSSSSLGGNLDHGDKRSFSLYDGTTNIGIPYDDIATMQISHNDEPGTVDVIITLKTGEIIKGSHYVFNNSSRDIFTGISPTGWITANLLSVSRIEFKGARD